MNWIKTKDKLPPFKHIVLLLEKKNEGKSCCCVGHLEKIDSEGNHWNWSQSRSESFNDIFSSFFSSAKIEGNISKFNPTHWCEIELPKE